MAKMKTTKCFGKVPAGITRRLGGVERALELVVSRYGNGAEIQACRVGSKFTKVGTGTYTIWKDPKASLETAKTKLRSMTSKEAETKYSIERTISQDYWRRGR